MKKKLPIQQSEIKESHIENTYDILAQYKKLGLKIAYYRKQKGLTQLELAEAINISRTYISNIEAPKSNVNPTLEVILNIATTLDVPVYKLFDETL
ncbi:MAG: helix-turn-helix domain-containing protein [Lachnospiraceae bacterium]|nr:helix-turn-helix domain-containing protein [Lachnospiraceae bacterium]